MGAISVPVARHKQPMRLLPQQKAARQARAAKTNGNTEQGVTKSTEVIVHEIPEHEREAMFCLAVKKGFPGIKMTTTPSQISNEINRRRDRQDNFGIPRLRIHYAEPYDYCPQKGPAVMVCFSYEGVETVHKKWFSTASFIYAESLLDHIKHQKAIRNGV